MGGLGLMPFVHILRGGLFLSLVCSFCASSVGFECCSLCPQKQAVKFRLLSGSTRNSLLLGHRDGTSLSELRFKFYEDPTSTAADGASDIAVRSAVLC